MKVWIVEQAQDRAELADKLNKLAAHDFQIFAVVSECLREGYDFSIIAYRPKGQQ